MLVHGFASCSTILGLKVSKLLATKFRLILIDLIGMGGSSRPKNYDKHKLLPEQSTEYFVEYLEKWRQEMELTNFYLVGHSFGGWICGNYAVKYHYHIKKLILITPIGLKQNDSFGKPLPCCLKCCRPCLKRIWKSKISPFQPLRCLGRRFTACFFSNYVKRIRKFTE